MFKKRNKQQSQLMCMLIGDSCLFHLLNNSLQPTKKSELGTTSPVLRIIHISPIFFPQCAFAKGVPWKTNKIPKIWSSPHNFNLVKREIRTPKIVYEFSWFIRPRLQDKLSFNSFVIDNCAFMYIVMSWLFLDWYKHQYICIPKQKIHHLFVIGTVKNLVLPKT